MIADVSMEDAAVPSVQIKAVAPIFQRRSSRLVVSRSQQAITTAVVIYCIFSFKWNLVAVVSNSGLRADDILILFALLVNSLPILHFAREKQSAPLLACIILITSQGVASGLTAYLSGEMDLSTFVFAGRQAEYFIFFYFGRILATSNWWSKNEVKVIVFYVWYLTALVAAQTAGIAVAVTDFSLDRASGNLGGPWELAAVSAFLYFYLHQQKKPSLALLPATTMLLSAARITIVAWVILALMRPVRRMKNLRPSELFSMISIALVLIIGTAAFIIYSPQGNELWDRAQSSIVEISTRHGDRSTASQSSFKVASSKEYRDIAFAPDFLDDELSSSDPSLSIRFVRWDLLISLIVQEPLRSITFGFGPGAAGTAVDGFWVRVFFEIGAIGTLAYVVFFHALLRRINYLAKTYLIVLLVSSALTDVLFTYKAMMFLYLIAGTHFSATGRRSVNQ